MPNHCMNTLSITGPQQDVETFKEFAQHQKEQLDITKFAPMPDELKNTESPNRDGDSATRLLQTYGAPDWFTWAVDHWGTKWEPYDVERTEPDDTTLEYHFCTAWSPLSDQLIETMSKRFPSLLLKLSYEEPGMAFEGHCNAQDGQILESECHGIEFEEPDPEDED